MDKERTLTHPAPMRRGPAVWAWVGSCVALSPLFYVFDWGEGPVRTGLLGVWLLLGMGLRRLVARAPAAAEPPAWLRRGLWWLAAGMFGFHLWVGVAEVRRTAELDAIRLDQGQIVYRSIRLFGRLNPYAHDVMLDPVYYLAQLQRWQPSGCLQFAPSGSPHAPQPAHHVGESLRDAQARFWNRLDVSAMAALMPQVDPAPRCAGARLGFASLGFKYGPVDLLAYAPAVLLWGKPGVFLVQLAVFVGICGLSVALGMGRLGRRSAGPPLVLCVLLGMPHLRHNVLETSALDALPVLLALGALWAVQSGRGALAALALGLSLAAKPLPGLLYAPLARGFTPRARGLALGAAVLPYLPFALWDGRGLLNNVLLYPLTRHSDSTALMHFLPPVAKGVWLATCAGLGLFWLLPTLGRGASRARFADHLLASHLLVLSGASYLHNNYLTWLAPVLALWTLQLWGSPPAEAAAPEPAPRGA